VHCDQFKVSSNKSLIVYLINLYLLRVRSIFLVLISLPIKPTFRTYGFFVRDSILYRTSIMLVDCSQGDQFVQRCEP
jgi:hypothetical protein